MGWGGLGWDEGEYNQGKRRRRGGMHTPKEGALKFVCNKRNKEFDTRGAGGGTWRQG